MALGTNYARSSYKRDILVSIGFILLDTHKTIEAIEPFMKPLRKKTIAELKEILEEMRNYK